MYLLLQKAFLGLLIWSKFWYFSYIFKFRSRLHLISTLAQEMRRFVLDLRQSPPEKFASRDRLHVLAASHFTVFVLV